MSNQDSTPHYDTKTEDNGRVYVFFGSHTYTTTIRDNYTGKEYSDTDYDPEKSRDGAWEEVRQDDD